MVAQFFPEQSLLLHNKKINKKALLKCIHFCPLKLYRHIFSYVNLTCSTLYEQLFSSIMRTCYLFKNSHVHLLEYCERPSNSIDSLEN